MPSSLYVKVPTESRPLTMYSTITDRMESGTSDGYEVRLYTSLEGEPQVVQKLAIKLNDNLWAMSVKSFKQEHAQGLEAQEAASQQAQPAE